MKSKFSFLLFAFFAFILCACENSNKSLDVNMQQLVGVWGFYNDQGYVLQHDRFYEIKEDGTFNILHIHTEDNNITFYSCYAGNVSIKNDVLSLRFKTFRDYIFISNIIRIAGINFLTSQSDLQITAFSEQKVSFSNGAALYKLEQKPEEWKPEFFEEEKAINYASLYGKWDVLNYLQQTADGATCFSYNSPDRQGIVLLPENQVVNCYFLVNTVYEMLIERGKITSEDDISVAHKDCQWSLEDDMFILSCSTYSLYYSDTQETSDPITLDAPIKIELEVISFTDSFLILYSAHWDRYYIFTPGSFANNAPQHRTSVSSKLRAMVVHYIAQSPNHECFSR